MKDIAITVGHTSFRQGACSPHGIPCEWTFNKNLAEYFKKQADIYFYDSYNFGYTSMVKRNAKKLNQHDYLLNIELHYNAASSPQANGCEALYYFKNPEGKRLAEEFCNLYQLYVGGKSRGAKARYSANQRGFAALYYPKATTLILEPFFGTNKNDVEMVTSRFGMYVKVIEELIVSAKNQMFL